MKISILSMITIFVAIAASSYSSHLSNIYVCQWFIVDGVDGTGDHNNLATYTESLDQLNYRPLNTGENVNVTCPNTSQLCAICAEPTAMPVSGKIRPKITSQTIKITLDKYFGHYPGTSPQDPFIVDYPTEIKERLEVTFFE